MRHNFFSILKNIFVLLSVAVTIFTDRFFNVYRRGNPEKPYLTRIHWPNSLLVIVIVIDGQKNLLISY